MADDSSSLNFLRRHPFWWFLIGPAGAAGSVWGKRLGEGRPLLGHIVFILGLALIAIGHRWGHNGGYARRGAHHRRSGLGHQRGLRSSCRSSSASSVYVSNTGTSGFVLYARVSRPAAGVVLESAGARLPATHTRAHLRAG